ncbi:DM13 domain-containing protein [Nitrososphaera viennensis]|nr:DM13 domain-containing protein [Nitrososphaera viennensis]UVS69383.1 DM13 domain-containing protein [Nitrososphaera viennensis]
MNKRVTIAAIVAAAILVPATVYAASPLFITTMIDEPSPIANAGDAMMAEKNEEDAMADDNDRKPDGTMMSKDEAEIDKGSTEDDAMMKDKVLVETGGTFAGAGDGFHNAEGTARVLHLGSGSSVLRLEEFKVTNGPDLYVYLSADKSNADYVSLGRLKASSGNQNYDLPDGIDLSRYDNVIIWCQSFSVYFGGAQLTTTSA